MIFLKTGKSCSLVTVFLFSHAFPLTEGALVFVLFVGFVSCKASCLRCGEMHSGQELAGTFCDLQSSKDWRQLKESQGPEGGRVRQAEGRRPKISDCAGSHFPIESWQEEGGDHI